MIMLADKMVVEEQLNTLETDKATMDVPATVAGRVVDVLVVRGDKVSQGTKLVRVETIAAAAATAATTGTSSPAASPAPAAVPAQSPAQSPAIAPARASAAEPAADREVQLL